MIGRIFPLTDDDPFLSSTEVAERVCAAFPKCFVDNKRAYDLLQVELEKLEARGTPLPILQGHKNLFGKTTSIEVPSPANSNIAVRFMVYPDSPIEVFAIPPEITSDENGVLRILVRKIAEALAYDVEFAS